MTLDASNPFAILGASTRDRKTRLYELAEDAALHGDPELAVEARNMISNPRTRLQAEVAWYPGLSPRRVAITLEQLRNGSIPSFDGMNALCRANFACEALVVYAAKNELEFGIEELAAHAEEVSPQDILIVINEDRHAAGFPVTSDTARVEAELSDRIKHYERKATALLNELPSVEMVAIYERLITASTYHGVVEGHRLIQAMIDAYSLKAGRFLTEQMEHISGLIEAATTASDKHEPEQQLNLRINEIVGKLKTWDSVAQPIQVAYKSRGLKHEESRELASRTRNLGIHLFNQHDYLDEAKRLSEALKELFAEDAIFSERVNEDIEALTDIERSRAERDAEDAAEAAEFEQSISYETEFGLLFKDKFRISPVGFDYQGVVTPLDNITGVCWGATRKSANGISSGMEYYFSYGTPQSATTLKPSAKQYDEIVQRAWRAACIPILLRWIDNWTKGGTVLVAGYEVSDNGIVLRRSRFLKDDEKKFFPWSGSGLRKRAHNGELSLSVAKEPKFRAVMSFRDAWNVHIFNFALDRIWRSEAGQLSKIFGG